MNTIQLQVEGEFSLDIGNILNEKTNLFERLVRFLDYQSSQEMLQIFRKDEQKYLKNPELFFHSTLYKRQHKFLFGHKSFFSKMAFDLHRYPLYNSNFNSLLTLVIYEMLNREFDPNINMRDQLDDRIKDYENLEERLRLEGLTVQHFISHMYRLLDAYKSSNTFDNKSQFHYNSFSSNHLTLQQINVTNNINIFERKTDKSKRTLVHKSDTSDMKPFPIIDLGEIGHFMSDIGNILYQRRYIDNLPLFQMLYEVTNIDVEQTNKVKWNSLEQALIYLFVLLLNFKVIAISERSEIPMYLERAFLYKLTNGKYRSIDYRNVHKTMNKIEKVGVEKWAQARRNGVYREIYKIITGILTFE